MALLVRGLKPRALLQLGCARRCAVSGPVYVFIAVCDHYEPKWNRPSKQVWFDRVGRWEKEYPLHVAGLGGDRSNPVLDSRARGPQHSFFYPQDEYEPELVEPIARLCRQGHGDIEVHLHHDGDTEDQLREKLQSFTKALHTNHGVLRPLGGDRYSYAFIHGNWALCNSRPDGRWCGVNNELTILRETGCYADFTMPAAPDPCQTSTINQIYYAKNIGAVPKSHDRGKRAAVGVRPDSDSLLMIQGPLGLDWNRRKYGCLPRLENGDLTRVHPPSLQRFHLWRAAGVSVAGRENWIFVKLHTHGAQEANTAMFFGDPMRRFHQSLAEYARCHDDLNYYYVTAREMAGLVRQAEKGLDAPDFSQLA